VTPGDLASWLRSTGARITDADVELIAATRLAGQSLTEVAAVAGIPVEAAYKRRRRAEQRVADALQTTREASAADPVRSRPGS
jgi:DNA-directed RNA polymerase specialized sigma24 family protein